MQHIRKSSLILHFSFSIRFTIFRVKLFYARRKPHFKPTLGLTDATMIVAGSMIGSGIFLVSADIVRNVGGAGWLILVWLITGFMTLTAAVSYGELSGMFPKAGGQYVYLKEAYNPLISFLYGWSLFAVIQTGTIAAVGVAFSKYAAYLIPALSEDNHILRLQTGIKCLWRSNLFHNQCCPDCFHRLIGLLTYTNTRGVKGGKWIQNIFTSTKLLALFGLIIAGFIAFHPEVWHANWSAAWQATKIDVSRMFAILRLGLISIPLVVLRYSEALPQRWWDRFSAVMHGIM